MKTIIIKLMAVSLAPVLLLCGCDRMGQVKTPITVKQITAVAATSEDMPVRTTLNSSRQVEWEAGDAIGVSVDGGALAQFTAAGSGLKVEFNGAAGGLQVLEGTLYGVNPYDVQNVWENGNIISMIPHNQYASNGTTGYWDPRALVAVGHCSSDDLVMPFYNAHALVKVIFPLPENLNGFTPNAVTLSAGAEDEYLSGYVMVDPSSTTPSAALLANGTHYVSFINESMGSEAYLAVIPGTVTNPVVSMSGMHSGSGALVKSTKTGTLTFERNKIYTLDFSSVEVQDVGSPFAIPNGNGWTATLLMVSSDGSVIFIKDHNGSPQAKRWSTLVYESNAVNADPITFGDHDFLEFEKASDVPSYRVKLSSGTYSGYYFAYSVEKQGSYLVANAADATVFTLYEM